MKIAESSAVLHYPWLSVLENWTCAHTQQRGGVCFVRVYVC